MLESIDSEATRERAIARNLNHVHFVGLDRDDKGQYEASTPTAIALDRRIPVVNYHFFNFQ